MSRDLEYRDYIRKSFILQGKLGSGTFAMVYKALDKAKNTYVAIKCIDKTSITKSGADSIVREIQIMKMLKHPNIVEMLEFHWDSRYVYIVLEYCNEGDFSKYTKCNGKLPEDVCKKFIVQLVQGLKYLRSKDIYHYDLKPQNVLIAKDEMGEEILKISDFGLSLFANTKHEFGRRGSPAYMAPEVLMCDKYDPSRIDMWSLGVILYQTLHGKLPLPSRNVQEIVAAVKAQKPIKMDSSLTPECKSVLRKLLHYNASGRITFEQLLKHPFIGLEFSPPTEESFMKASKVTNEAVLLDYHKDYLNAFNKYSEAVKYMMPFVTVGMNEERRELTLNKIKICVKRIDALKVILFPAKIHFDLIPKVGIPGSSSSSSLSDEEDDDDDNSENWKEVVLDRNAEILEDVISSSDIELIEEASDEPVRNLKEKKKSTRKKDREYEMILQDSSEDEIPSTSTNKVEPDHHEMHALRLNGEQVGLLKSMAKPTPKMFDGLDIGYMAQMYLFEGNYTEALEKFMIALSVLVPLLRKEPPGRRKELLTIQVKEMLSQAESIKTLSNAHEDLRNFSLSEGIKFKKEESEKEEISDPK